MPIRRNDSDSFPGANSIFVPPVVKADCCLFQTRQEMAEHAAAEGWPYMIKGGVVHVDASLAEIQTVCLLGEPTITNVLPDPLEELASWTVYGEKFGPVEGELWLTSHATWEASTTKVRQTPVTWEDALVSSSWPVMDGLPSAPAHIYVYVINDCGERNAVGFEVEYQQL